MHAFTSNDEDDDDEDGDVEDADDDESGVADVVLCGAECETVDAVETTWQTGNDASCFP